MISRKHVYRFFFSEQQKPWLSLWTEAKNRAQTTSHRPTKTTFHVCYDFSLFAKLDNAYKFPKQTRAFIELECRRRAKTIKFKFESLQDWTLPSFRRKRNLQIRRQMSVCARCSRIALAQSPSKVQNGVMPNFSHHRFLPVRTEMSLHSQRRRKKSCSNDVEWL